MISSDFAEITIDLVEVATDNASFAINLVMISVDNTVLPVDFAKVAINVHSILTISLIVSAWHPFAKISTEAARSI